jgi:hypothetical protein
MLTNCGPTGRLTTHVRQHCGAAGHPALRQLSRSKYSQGLRP